jgi:hypothetical protein
MATKQDKSEEVLPELSPSECKLGKQLEAARRDKHRYLGEWQSSESSLFDIGSEGGALRTDSKMDSIAGDEGDIGSQGDVSDNFMGINISARNFQLIFSQLTSNTPVVMAIAQSNEQSDINAAKTSEATMSWGRKHYNVDNKISLAVYNTFVYGTGFVKQIYDGSLGSLMAANDSVKTTGDHRFLVPSPWDMFVDPNARTQDDIKWVSERMFVDCEDACRFFPEELHDIIRANRIEYEEAQSGADESLFYTTRHDCVEIYERWETGLPENKYKGKLTYHLKSGQILLEKDSPCAHAAYPDSQSRKSVRSRLPYSILSYEDIPNSVWGRSPAAKVSRAQHVLNALYMVILQTAQNMGTPNLVVNRDSLGESAQDIKTNNSINIIPLNLAGESGGTMPFTLQGANTSNDTKIMLDYLTNYINEGWGVNDALLGRQSRETAGVTTQLSIMQGNTIRERLFAKYVYFVEDIYNLFIADVAKNWKLERIVKVVGENNRVRASAIVGADIASGYIIKVERNSIFALDPITRQEQLLNLREVFTEAGMDPRQIVRYLGIADLRSVYDEFDLADNRAQKVIEAIKEGSKVKIFKFEDHIGIFAYMKRYTMTEEFFNLDDEVQAALEKHMDERMKQESKNRLPEARPQQAAPQQAPAPFALAGAPPQIGPV